LAAPLLYHDIPDWRNHIGSGNGHNRDDNGTCNVCALLAAREEEHMCSAHASNEALLLEQHYGMPTIGLDVVLKWPAAHTKAEL
jgi:hypothetical protein